MLQIERIIGSMSYGKSKPIQVIADDGKVYVVKFRKDHVNGKDRSNTNEYIAYKLIEHFTLHLAPQRLKFIEIDDLAIELAKKSTISKESLAYMVASKGTNIAIEFLEDCEKATKQEIDHKAFISEVRTIDTILMNADRTLDNTNILRDQTKKSKFYAIDWGLSLDATELYSDVKKGTIDARLMYYQNVNVVKRPEYIFKDSTSFTSLDTKDIEAIIRQIIEEIPTEWETSFCAEHIIEILTSRVQNKI